MAHKPFMIRFLSIAAVIAVIAAGIIYFMLQSSKSPALFYFEVEAKNFKRYSTALKSDWNAFSDGQKPYIDSDYNSRTEINADITPESSSGKLFGVNGAKAVFDLIGKMSLVVNTTNSIKRNESIAKVSLSIENSPLIDINAVTGAGKTFLSVPVLLPDRYLSVDLNKADEVYDKFGLFVRPSRFITKHDIAANLNIDGKKLDRSGATYGDMLKSYIGAANVSYGGNVDFTLGNKTVKGLEIMISLDAQKAGSLLHDLFIKAADDDLLKSVVFDNIASLISIYSKAGYFESLWLLGKNGYIGMSPDMVKSFSGLDAMGKGDPGGEIRQLLKDAAACTVASQGVAMKVVSDSSGNLLQREVLIPLLKSDGTALNVKLLTRMNDLNGNVLRNSYHRVEIEQVLADGKKSSHIFEFNSDFNGSDGNGSSAGKGAVEITVSDTGISAGSVKIKLDIDRSTDNFTLTGVSSIAYEITVNRTGDAMPGIIKGTVGTTGKRNDKKNTNDTVTDITAGISLPSRWFYSASANGGMEAASLHLKLSNETVFGQDFKLPDISSSSVTDLNSLDAGGVSGLLKQVAASFGAFYIDNKDIFDALLGGK